MTEAVALVTGASGFIGGAMARKLAERGFAVTGLVRRPLDASGGASRISDYSEESIRALVSELRPALLVHAAGTASVAASISDPATDFNGSVELFQRVLEGVRRSAARPRVAYVSSAAVYGNPEALPVPESARLSPISPYGHHKLMCETLAEEYAACFGVPALVLRAFSVFGAGQRRLLVWDLFRKFMEGSEVVVDGTGEESRDYLHVDDFAELSVAVLSAVRAPHDVLNVASGRSVKVRELAKRMGQLLASSKKIVFTGKQRPGDPREWRADASRCQALLGGEVPDAFDRRLGEVLNKWRV